MSLLNQVRPNILGMKSYQAGKPIEEVKREFGIEEIVKLASNENPLGPSKQALQRLKDSDWEYQLYPDGSCFELKTALGEFYQLKADNFVVSNGSDEILDQVMAVLVNPGDEVIYADPSFIKYKLSVQRVAGVCVSVPLDEEYKHDLDQMLAAITDKTKVIMVCNPNNPTGTIVGKQELLSFLSKVPQHILVVLDQAYREYVSDEEYLDGVELLDHYPNLLILQTFSKIYGLAGFRVGYGIAQPELVEMLNRVRSPFNVNTVAQRMAMFALEDQEHVVKGRAVNDAGKEYLYKELEAMGLRYIPTHGNFLMVDMECDTDVLFQELLRRGVIIRPGKVFAMPSWIRVTIGLEHENQRFIEVLKEVLGNEEISA